ncbi:MAG: SufE family protein [Chlamydiales bacterium]
MSSLEQKFEAIKTSFSDCTSPAMKYQRIMNWGKKLPPFDPQWEKEENLVSGCQSTLYLHAVEAKNKIYFSATSDALISAGLAALLIEAYSGEKPETILTYPPRFLDELEIPISLTPGRANGLASLYLKMKQEALKYLLLQAKQ